MNERPLFLKHLLIVFGFILPVSTVACRPSPNKDATHQKAADASHPKTSSGSDGTSPARAVALEDRAALIQIWQEFASDWNSKDPARLARWNPPQGVFLLDNPGAFVRVQLRAGVPELLTLPGEYDGARIKSALLSETIDEGPLPQVRCEDAEVLPNGVFLGATDASFLATYVTATREYDLAPQDEAAHLAEVERSYAPFKKFLVHDTRANISFLFALAEGAVVVVAVNAVIPCSA